jgi:cell wall-associated NlpC family hydrolase
MATVLALRASPSLPPGWTAVTLPDGRSGFVPTADLRVLGPGQSEPVPPASRVLALARLYLGTPYVWGGMSVKGVDCSGFTHTVYRLCGLKIHRDADQQFDHDGVPVPLDRLQPGDLIFFKTTRENLVTHVAFYVGGGVILHASSKYHGVTLTRLSDSYLQRRIAGARRILPANDGTESSR